MKAIIISLTKYKEKDAIVDAISETGYITFKANGILDPKNKNSGIVTPLTLAELTFSQTKNENNMILKESSVLFVPLKANNSLEYLSYVNYLTEVTRLLLSDEEKNYIYPDLHEAILALKKEEHSLLVLLKYTTAIFKNSGFELNVSSCIRCGGKNNIVAFSFTEGGFICQDCLTKEDSTDLNRNQMLLLRNIYLSKSYNFTELNYLKEDAQVLLTKFIEFIYDAYGHHIKSLLPIN